MSKKIICDRCKKEISVADRTLPNWADVQVKPGNVDFLDLCKDCVRDLQKWFYLRPGK